MKLASEFIRLPLRFDSQRLQQELAGFPASAWEAHPLDFAGNSALPLVSAGGGINNDFSGHMQATPALLASPYLQQVLASFNTVIGRSRLMRLAPGSVVPAHSDTNYTWRKRIRIHIPIVTDPAVVFRCCDGMDVHMAAGEAWVFDNWRQHTVLNNSTIDRVHLVLDTTGTADFWELVKAGWDPAAGTDSPVPVPVMAYQQDWSAEQRFERFNAMLVLPPAEIDNLAQEFLQEVAPLQQERPQAAAAITGLLENFCFDWRSNWSLYGDTRGGIPHYEALVLELRKRLGDSLANVSLQSNGADAREVLESWLDACVDKRLLATGAISRPTAADPEAVDTSLFENPVFIVAAPRSGSTMLFELLQQNMELWSIGDESHGEFESIRSLHPASHQFASNVLGADDATPQVTRLLFDRFVRKIRNSQGTLLSMLPAETRPPGIRFLEKTPKNALRIPFLRKMFPSALFIFLYRDPRENLGAIMDAWKSGNFVTYPGLPGWQGPPWSLLLVPGWRELQGRPLAEIAAHQWQQTNDVISRDLADCPDQNWCAVSYEGLLNNREGELRRLCDFINVPFGPRMQSLCQGALPLSRYTLTPPDPDKWRRYEAEIEAQMPALETTTARLAALTQPG